jgi:hypothetical protein
MRATVLASLVMACLASVSACTAQAPGGPEPIDRRIPPPPELTGAWRASIDVQSGAFATAKGLEFMYLFHMDHTLTESSNYDAAPPVPPAYGVWRMVPGAGNVFEAKYEFFTTVASPPDQFKTGAGWLPSGRGVFTEQITVAMDGRTFTSVIRYELFDATGAAVTGGGSATGRGTRIDF